MIPIFRKTAVSALLVLVSLWTLQGCARVSTQSPSEIEAPSPTRPELPAVMPPHAPVIPGEALPEGKASVSDEPKQVPHEVRSASYVHVVRWKGETLSLIAQWYTGSWNNWELIAKANPGIKPERITIGDRIQVPKELMRRRDPLPFDFLRHPSPGSTRPKRAGASPPLLTGETKLFGPVEATGRQKPTPAEIELLEPREISGKRTQTPEEADLFGPVE